MVKGKKKNEEERELMADFYEVFLENFQEEGERRKAPPKRANSSNPSAAA